MLDTSTTLRRTYSEHVHIRREKKHRTLISPQKKRSHRKKKARQSLHLSETKPHSLCRASRTQKAHLTVTNRPYNSPHLLLTRCSQIDNRTSELSALPFHRWRRLRAPTLLELLLELELLMLPLQKGSRVLAAAILDQAIRDHFPLAGAVIGFDVVGGVEEKLRLCAKKERGVSLWTKG